MFVSRSALSSGVLLAAATEGGDGGGAKGEEKPGLTEEDVGKIVNSAVTSQLKRVLGPALAEALGGLKLDEKIAEAVSKAAPAKSEEEKPEKNAKETALEKSVRELSEKLEKSEAARAEGDKQRAQIEQDRRFDAGVAALRAQLDGKVNKLYLDDAVDRWAKLDGRLKIAEDGTATFRVKRAPYKGASEVDEDLPLAEAIPLMLASKDAARFLPAPGGGSGTQKISRAPTGSANQGGGSGASDPMTKSINDLAAIGVDPLDLLT
jgi:hypothetical protein